MYINFVIEENQKKYIEYWLLLITFLVIVMIVVGGLTRLTDSGLSITNWDLISGIIPPFTENKWEYYFSLYKKIPEYTLINSSMTIEEFKIIYWWEYIHRLLGRLIGLLYLIPLLYFKFKNILDSKFTKSLYLILFLIILQGVVGWYMVMSGLTENVDVSHYRLSLHLSLAFVILILLFWNYLKLKSKNLNYTTEKIPPFLPIFFLAIIFIQISTGALVSGLDAGQIYQSWPLMDKNYFPDDSELLDLFSINLFNTPSLVQFLHRNIAYFLIILFIYLSIFIYSNNKYSHFKTNINIIFIALAIQIALGIFTILSGAKIYIASAHQIGSILLILSSVQLVFKNSITN